MNIDYTTLLPIVLTKMFPDSKLRSEVVTKLDRYGAKSFHREIERVRLGILKLVHNEPDKLEYYVTLACDDYRDLLCCAEYPLTSRRYGLKEKDPEKDKELSSRESQEYKDWLDKLLGI